MEGRLRLAPVLMLTLSALATGCSSTITNLTPSALPRDPTGLYHFEAEWTSTQRSRELRADTIRAYVVADQKAYPMERVQQMKDRWEADIPIAPGTNVLYYQYKWDYATAGFGKAVPNSLRSQTYRLEIVDTAASPR